MRDAPYARPVKKFPRNEFFEAPVVRTAGGGFYMHDDRVEDEEPAYSEAPKELTTGVKMLVSNLGPEVTEEDLQELFTEHGGPLKKVEVFYKQDGSSSGQAEVVFKQKKDAEKVLATLQSVPLDGKPLQLALVGIPASASAFSRPAPAAATTTITVTGMGGGFRGGGGGGAYRSFQGRSRGFGGGGARGGRRGGRGGGMSAKDLDQGMDDYHGD